jgi:hypothetical protein
VHHKIQLQPFFSICISPTSTAPPPAPSQVANWADQVRSQPDYKWSAPLHFIDTPDWECAYTPATDCVDSKCVAGAIGNYSKRVVSMDGDTADEAAKFITHFCGDIHQPLQLRPQRCFVVESQRSTRGYLARHSAYFLSEKRASVCIATLVSISFCPHSPFCCVCALRSVSFLSDRGGNDITGTFFGDDDNLHYIWDTAIIKEHMNRDFNSDQNQYANFLLSTITAANATAWTKCLAVAVRCVWCLQRAGGLYLATVYTSSQPVSLACHHQTYLAEPRPAIFSPPFSLVLFHQACLTHS